jgi:tRNA(Arg) A34 adenosine deaminase TadA
MTAQPDSISIHLPAWLSGFARPGAVFSSQEERMRLVISASRHNVEEGSGGPFAAAVFQRDSGVLVSLGVNLVVSGKLSMLHAEMVAITLAQQSLGVFDLGGVGMDGRALPAHELVSSCEPCAMCFGAIPWSGVRQLLTGAAAEDAEAIGFDEGPKVGRWQLALEQRNIRVVTGVLRSEAAAVLQEYRCRGGVAYNGRGVPPR